MLVLILFLSYDNARRLLLPMAVDLEDNALLLVPLAQDAALIGISLVLILACFGEWLLAFTSFALRFSLV